MKDDESCRITYESIRQVKHIKRIAKRRSCVCLAQAPQCGNRTSSPRMNLWTRGIDGAMSDKKPASQVCSVSIKVHHVTQKEVAKSCCSYISTVELIPNIAPFTRASLWLYARKRTFEQSFVYPNVACEYIDFIEYLHNHSCESEWEDICADQ